MTNPTVSQVTIHDVIIYKRSSSKFYILFLGGMSYWAEKDQIKGTLDHLVKTGNHILSLKGQEIVKEQEGFLRASFSREYLGSYAGDLFEAVEGFHDSVLRRNPVNVATTKQCHPLTRVYLKDLFPDEEF